MKSLSSFVLVLSLMTGASAVYAQESPQELLDSGNLAQAVSVLERDAADADPVKSISGNVGLAQIALAKDDIASAEKYAGEAAGKIESVEHKSGWRVIIPWLNASIAAAKKDIPSAKSAIRLAETRIEDGAEVDAAWKGLVMYQMSMIFDDDNSRARRAAESAIEAYGKIKMHHEKGHACMRLGDLEWARDKKRRAFNAYDDALRAYRLAEAHFDIAAAQLRVAERFIEDGTLTSAKSRLSIAETEIQAAGNPDELVRKFDDLTKKAESQPL